MSEKENLSEKTTARLVVSRGETSGRHFVIEQGENLIGRWDPDEGIFPEIDLEDHDPDAKVSRRHAIISHTSKGLEIEDVGSLNGTFLNRGERLPKNERHTLKNGDELIIGKTFLRLEC